jgi:hypothetical protein
LLFGFGQNTLQANYNQIADQVRTDVLGATAHLLLLKARDSCADGRFNFAVSLHGNLGPFEISTANER